MIRESSSESLLSSNAIDVSNPYAIPLPLQGRENRRRRRERQRRVMAAHDKSPTSACKGEVDREAGGRGHAFPAQKISPRPRDISSARASRLSVTVQRHGCPLLCRCYGASGEGIAPSAIQRLPMELPMSQHCHFDASRSLTALEQDSTIIAVIEMSQTKWLVAALIPGVERQPLKKFDAHEETLLKLLHRWRREAGQAGRNIKRIVVAFEAGRDGFWLVLRPAS